MTLAVTYIGASIGGLIGFGLGLTTKPVLESNSVGLSSTVQTMQTFIFAASFGALGMLGEVAFGHLKATTSLSTVIDMTKILAAGLVSVVCSSYLPEKVKKDPVAKIMIPTLITTACAYSALY